MGSRGHPPRVGPYRDRNGGQAKGNESIAIARVAGFDHPDAGSRLEHRQERQGESGRRAGDDDYPLGFNLLIAFGDPFPERLSTCRVGVSEGEIELFDNGDASLFGKPSHGLTNL